MKTKRKVQLNSLPVTACMFFPLHKITNIFTFSGLLSSGLLLYFSVKNIHRFRVIFCCMQPRCEYKLGTTLKILQGSNELPFDDSHRHQKWQRLWVEHILSYSLGWTTRWPHVQLLTKFCHIGRKNTVTVWSPGIKYNQNKLLLLFISIIK